MLKQRMEEEDELSKPRKQQPTSGIAVLKHRIQDTQEDDEEIREKKKNCDPREMSRIHHKCRSLIRQCTIGMLVNMSSKDFQDIEDLDESICSFLTCDKYWDDYDAHITEDYSTFYLSHLLRQYLNQTNIHHAHFGAHCSRIACHQLVLLFFLLLWKKNPMNNNQVCCSCQKSSDLRFRPKLHKRRHRQIHLNTFYDKNSPEYLTRQNSPEYSTSKMPPNILPDKILLDTTTDKILLNTLTDKTLLNTPIDKILSNKSAPEYVFRKNSPEYISRQNSLKIFRGKNSPEYISRQKFPENFFKTNSPEYISRQNSPEYISRQNSPEYISRKNSPEYISRQNSPEFIKSTKEKPDFYYNKPSIEIHHVDDSHRYQNKQNSYETHCKRRPTELKNKTKFF
ncbi:hypothetical protein CEXT_570541 [Caerostris extrusa]|uniref:Uncharacterized protein n=1 Tax=Caerostris extrusa TaxID=172846 RepID=A0AAV4SXD6_CAEEX|nr:hypothetical protein CEXT_570541 [Caerostris extrusa]